MKIKYIKYTELKIWISNEISMSFICAKSALYAEKKFVLNQTIK